METYLFRRYVPNVKLKIFYLFLRSTPAHFHYKVKKCTWRKCLFSLHFLTRIFFENGRERNRVKELITVKSADNLAIVNFFPILTYLIFFVWERSRFISLYIRNLQ